MFRQRIIKSNLGVRAALVLGLTAAAVLSVVAVAGPVWAWIDENRNEVSGEVGDVEWEGIAHIGLRVGDGVFLYTGSTLTQTDSTVHALRAQSRGEEWCGVLLNDIDWDVEWKASKTWITGGSRTGEAPAGACGDTPWFPYMVSNDAEHRVWLSNGEMDGDENSAHVWIPSFSPKGW